MDPLDGGTWNLRVGRRVNVAVDEVTDLIEWERLDFLTIIEASDYLPALARELRGSEWRVAGFPWQPPGPARDSAVILRRSLYHPRSTRIHRLGGVEWERRPGRPGMHWPRMAVSTRVDWLKVLAAHAPPTPNLRSYPQRDLAHAVALRRLHRIGNRWDRPWVMAGDWNMRKQVEGSWGDPSPKWLARELDGEIRGNGIDYVIARDDLKVTNLRRGDRRRSDHRPVLFTVAA